MFYIFHGEDEFGRSEELARLRGELAGGDRAMADLNTSILDGRRLTLGEVRHVADAIPFMADRRLVIVHGLLNRLAPSRSPQGGGKPAEEEPAWRRAFLADLLAYLPNLPPKTRLIFVESTTLPGSHPVLKLARSEGEKGQAHIKDFKLPKDRELNSWIRGRVRGKGGSIDPEATRLLAMLVGRDLRLLDQEIDKLLLYAEGRTVNARDVQLLVSRAREISIFDLVDAVGQRQTGRALRLLHGLLEDREAPLYLLTMLARQVRILLQVSELQDLGLNQQEITSRLKLHPFVAQKAMAQARNFQMAQLETAHQRLVETDWSIKTGKIEEVLALDMLVVSLCSV